MTKYKLRSLRLGRNLKFVLGGQLSRTEEIYGKPLIDLTDVGIFRKHSDF